MVFMYRHKPVYNRLYIPLGLVLQGRARVQEHLLVVLDRQVVASAFLVRHLHEKARHERLADVGVVVLALEVAADHLHAQARTHTHLCIGGVIIIGIYATWPMNNILDHNRDVVECGDHSATGMLNGTMAPRRCAAVPGLLSWRGGPPPCDSHWAVLPVGPATTRRPTNMQQQYARMHDMSCLPTRKEKGVPAVTGRCRRISVPES